MADEKLDTLEMPSPSNFLSIQSFNNKAIHFGDAMWIDNQGKIHVRQDAPADELAREVCRIICETFTLGK